MGREIQPPRVIVVAQGKLYVDSLTNHRPEPLIFKHVFKSQQLEKIEFKGSR